MHDTDAVKQFIALERTNDWLLHLSALYDTLRLFAAIVHGNYATRVHLQQMSTLAMLHEQFMKGWQRIRWSDRYLSELSCDSVIEVTMMCSIKGCCGLTTKRWIHETVRTVWVNTMTESAQVDMATPLLLWLRVDQTKHGESQFISCHIGIVSGYASFSLVHGSTTMKRRGRGTRRRRGKGRK